MSDTITITQEEIGAEAFTIAQLIGLLDASGALQIEWFENPAAALEAAPGRVEALVETLHYVLGPKADVNEPVFAGAEWYAIPNPSSSGGETGFYAVLPPAQPQDGNLGAGYEHQFAIGNLTINFYAYIPLFELINGGTPKFTLFGDNAKSAKVGIDISSSAPLQADGDVPFTNFVVEGDFCLGGGNDLFSLKIEFSDDQTVLNTYHTVTDFVNAATTGDRIGEMLVQGAAYWLSKYIGSSPRTIGDVMVAANMMGLSTSDTGQKYYHYDPDALKLISTNPLQAAENITFALLGALADDEKPLVPLKGGGIWAAYLAPDGATDPTTEGDYGLRLMIPDIAIALGSGPTSPTLHLRMGTWFTGEGSDADGWVNKIIGGASPLKPGMSVFALHYDGTNASFAPSFELVSLGFDLTGAANAPLFETKGVSLGAAEMRMYLNQPADWQFGFGARVDDVAIPLGTNFGSVSQVDGNDVASNLLASGSTDEGQPGGDAATGKTDAINPNFSLEGAYVSGAVADESWFVELLPPDGQSGDIVWFPVNKQLGPLDCEKIGLGWNQKDVMLDVVFDGGVALAGLAVVLDELSVGIPLAHPTTLSDYALDLKGLLVSYEGGGVEIAGGLLKSGSGDTLEYDGEAVLKFGKFGLGALGSYATLPGGGTSLFIFAFLDAPLGGLPSFFVTGLAAGFGYNRQLIPPPMDQVQDFPLVKAMSDPAALGIKPGQTPDLDTVLGTIKTSVPPSRGSYWLAAGVNFTTYEILKSSALVAVEFGNEFEILILGLSTAKLPQIGPTYAEVQLALEVLFAPSEGIFKASAMLTPASFVIDPACKLTGGFAFFAWFHPSDHAGDFVVTVGGYHPAFDKPDWYPDVPRVGFNWNVSDVLSISGGAYFALTPSCVMAGGDLQVLFHTGPIKAWFTAYADMLISWKPFYFQASIGVSIGCSVTVHLLFIHGTIKVEVGADLSLWGPPTGGKVRVHLWVCSFTIGFGDDHGAVKTVTDWQGFQQMLPGGDSTSSAPAPVQSNMHAALDAAPASGAVVCQIFSNSGIISTIEEADKTKTWVVNPSEFAFSVSTTIPATAVKVNDGTVELDVANDYFVAARPMGVDNLDTGLTITITGDHDADWEGVIDKQDVPEAIWGRPLAPGATPTASATLLPGRVVGLNDIVPEPHVPEGPPTIEIATAFTDVPVVPVPYPTLPLSQTPQTRGAVPAPGNAFASLAQINSDPAAAARADFFAAFDQLGVFAGSNGDMSEMAADPYQAYRDEPMLGSPLAA
ncbi:DUF6603 domain-containing protein [Hoeflea ulvae]|uniref:DUF6603 domain-containing protein n=1 Tax=Hoeflea ulvae TaxID=2983764 RepID=A0ABT3YG64_9HYPH|nr:DUF6603 domain-containing protein [Hoeflea ulvae]MCY0094901.1 hypothetical protein [Hoeflea ulvae]